MKRADFNNLKIGDHVQIKKNKCNEGRLGKIVYKAGEYVCLVPLDNEPLYKSPNQYRKSDPMLTMIVLHLSTLALC